MSFTCSLCHGRQSNRPSHATLDIPLMVVAETATRRVAAYYACCTLFGSRLPYDFLWRTRFGREKFDTRSSAIIMTYTVEILPVCFNRQLQSSVSFLNKFAFKVTVSNCQIHHRGCIHSVLHPHPMNGLFRLATARTSFVWKTVDF